jgi:hypothetical protein
MYSLYILANRILSDVLLVPYNFTSIKDRRNIYNNTVTNTPKKATIQIN